MHKATPQLDIHEKKIQTESLFHTQAEVEVAEATTEASGLH
jgi:hypothetical protein